MTEYQIEMRVEHMTDRLDRAFMSGAISQEKYDQEIKYWDDWANREYDKVTK